MGLWKGWKGCYNIFPVQGTSGSRESGVRSTELGSERAALAGKVS